MNRRDWAVDRADPQPPWGEIYWLRHCRVAAGAGVADAPGDDESALYNALERVADCESRLRVPMPIDSDRRFFGCDRWMSKYDCNDQKNSNHPCVGNQKFFSQISSRGTSGCDRDRDEREQYC